MLTRDKNCPGRTPFTTLALEFIAVMPEVTAEKPNETVCNQQL